MESNPKINILEIRNEKGQEEIDLLFLADEFLGEEKKMINHESFSEAIKKTEKEIFQNNEGTRKNQNVFYDKYKKRFDTEKENGLSAGSIVSAERWGIELNLSSNPSISLEEKKLQRMITEKKAKNILFNNLNKSLAESLFKETKQKDILKAKAYEAIMNRSETGSEQLGMRAEKIMLGVLEGLAIDRPDLGFNVIEANAYQDVNNKIDFIIASKQKKRGVGVDEKDFQKGGKSIGIQFTINTSKAEHKADQIQKAKARGVEVDDIIYVDLDQSILQNAIKNWKRDGNLIAGPWKYLPAEIRKQILSNLLNEIITEDQKKKLLENEKEIKKPEEEFSWLK